jgi:hypothetical protein
MTECPFRAIYTFPRHSLTKVSPLSGEVLFFAPPKKSTQKKGGPGGLPATRVALRFSPFQALAELAGFAAPYGLQIQLRQGGSLNPEMAAMLGCADGHQTHWL